MMILVDIQVPEIDGIYDFELDEDMAAGEAARAAAELTALWEGIFAGNRAKGRAHAEAAGDWKRREADFVLRGLLENRRGKE